MFARRIEKALAAGRLTRRRFGAFKLRLTARHAAIGERVGALVARGRVAAAPSATHIWCCAASASSSRHRSAFLTGLLSAVFQPLRFQPWIQVSMPFFTYCESV